MKGLGTLERQHLGQLQKAVSSVVSTREASVILSLSPEKTALLLSRLNKKGWVKRLKRGEYLLMTLSDERIPIDEDPFVISHKLFQPSYVGGWSAAHYWGLTDQLFEVTFVFTSKTYQKSEVTLDILRFKLRHTNENNFFGLKNEWRNTERVLISDPTKTIVDFLWSPNVLGGWNSGCDVLKAYFLSEHRDEALLLKYLERLGKKVAYKRLGYYLCEYLPYESTLINACLKNISPSPNPLVPGIPEAVFDEKWKLWVPKKRNLKVLPNLLDKENFIETNLLEEQPNTQENTNQLESAIS